MAAPRTVSLEQVRIAEPCTAPWNQMAGDDRSRYCTHCARHVHNLSAMTDDEAQRLICDTAGRLCVAFYPNPDGSPRTLDYKLQPARRRFGWRVTTLLGCLGASVAGAINYACTRKAVPATPVVNAPVPGMMVLGGPPLRGAVVMGLVEVPSTQPVVTGEAVDCPTDENILLR